MSDRRFLRLALLGYALVILTVLVLSPFRFAWPEQWQISWLGDLPDMPVNLLLFLPIGVLYRVAFDGGGRGGIPGAVIFAAGTSGAIEIAQLFLDTRLTSMADLLSNTVGAAAGAMLCNAARRRVDLARPGIPTSELPLTNHLYMLPPLMWLACAGLGGAQERAWALVPLGVAGAMVIVALWRFRHRATPKGAPARICAVVAAWFGIGAAAGILVAPLITLTAGAVAVTTALVLSPIGDARGRPERRFEATVLRGIWPCYIVYMLIITTGTSLHLNADFAWTLGYPQSGFHRDFTLRIAEQLAAVTVLGYLIGESLGRTEVNARAGTYRNLALAAACAVGVELMHGGLAEQRASLLRGSLSVLAAGFGVAMYAAQLSVVRVLRQARPAPAARGDGGMGAAPLWAGSAR